MTSIVTGVFLLDQMLEKRRVSLTPYVSFLHKFGGKAKRAYSDLLPEATEEIIKDSEAIALLLARLSKKITGQYLTRETLIGADCRGDIGSCTDAPAWFRGMYGMYLQNTERCDSQSASRLTRVPWPTTLIKMYAVIALRLDVDASNAMRSWLCAHITTQAVSPSRPDVMLQFKKLEIKPVAMLKTGPESLSLLKTHGDSFTFEFQNGRPPLLLSLTTDGDNCLLIPLHLPDTLIEHARRRPVFDDGKRITEEKVVA
ncbi:hypothetical protein DFH07DRAFT_779728 [Mycena maculata]|uniref:Uncharacterized protein n=1 Tax=Mycena maculata TaxID=230809 RepID=A0AAD7I6S5_9AGAR|nr:hypothetical protein DFH07DRAFT_779728 [Mycena maculata]